MDRIEQRWIRATRDKNLIQWIELTLEERRIDIGNAVN